MVLKELFRTKANDEAWNGNIHSIFCIFVLYILAKLIVLK